MAIMKKVTKVITRSGKVRFKSQVEYNLKLAEARREPSGDFWASYNPRRDYGVFANVMTHSYTHNGLRKWQ